MQISGSFGTSVTQQPVAESDVGDNRINTRVQHHPANLSVRCPSPLHPALLTMLVGSALPTGLSTAQHKESTSIRILPGGLYLAFPPWPVPRRLSRFDPECRTVLYSLHCLVQSPARHHLHGPPQSLRSLCRRLWLQTALYRFQ
jgi:hypothetical protein